MEGIIYRQTGGWIFNLYIDKLVLIIYYFLTFKMTTANSFMV